MFVGNHPPKKGADVGGLLFGLIFTLFSVTFLTAVLWPMLKGLEYYRWAKVSCVMDHAEISTNRLENPEFRPDLRFHYPWNGVAHQGIRLWFSKEGDSSYEEIWSEIEGVRAGAGAGVECRVNPADPSQAALLPDPIHIGSVVAQVGFMGFFIAIGLSLIRSSRRSESHPRVIPWLAAGFFTTAGLGLLLGLVLPALLQSFAARKWEACPARVIWSQIKTESSGRKTRKIVDVFYRYEFKGREYHSNRYDLTGGPWDKDRAVATHLPGTQFVSLVNPDKPWLALVERTLGLKFWLMGVFALSFIVVGSFMFRWLWLQRGKPKPFHDRSSRPYRSHKVRHRGWRR